MNTLYTTKKELNTHDKQHIWKNKNNIQIARQVNPEN
mgnify:CR=1 FL=1